MMGSVSSVETLDIRRNSARNRLYALIARKRVTRA
ncbi:hypothetical protein A2U01_0117615, partial [Trifolium medium]|nr:hypothetical protein [Trifolium medium]